MCSECPQGNGAMWCKGDCVWLDEDCIGRSLVRRLTTVEALKNGWEKIRSSIPGQGLDDLEVSCGTGHNATSCSQCPRDHGFEWCNGDCVWFEEEYIESKLLQRLEATP